ncbi:DUF2092 domain-containing protein [Adhaeribacter soli]|uniref:DUF2092 domain-containing protein n=1 Tax=Adhaeribacter soli TaxID=2607655 RepID=A0A5N1ISK0_9BACT|nr:DUF2092 domain-containing protein [Adhaeribacter soli]KAA9332638.1 DUF2092 domain-containing protein [Adhaeribacter soli]
MKQANPKQVVALRWLIFSLVLFGLGSMSRAMLAGRPAKKEAGLNKVQQQNPKVDKQADRILKQMSDNLTAMQQFSYTSTGNFEVLDKNNKKQKQNYRAQVFVKRPNKMRVNVKNENRDASVFYDGSKFTVLGRNANMYAQADAPPTLDAALDSAREKFLMDPPGSDILYSDPYTGLMELVTQGQLLKDENINGKACHHLAFKSQDVDWEMWVQKGNTALPLRYKIISKNEPGKPEFTVDFSDWKQGSGPEFADQQFTFVPPANARKIPFMRLGDAPKVSQR